MTVRMVAELAWYRAQLTAHERRQRDYLEAYRRNRLAALRFYAYEHSPFYRSFHKGLEEAPLSELPVLTKRHVMENFDSLVTDPDVRLADVRRYISRAVEGQLYRDRYWVCTTSGTSGLPGVFVNSVSEWATILASYARASRWAGGEAGLIEPIKMALVASDKPSHQSNAVATSLSSYWVQTLSLPVTVDLRDIIEALNRFQPGLLVAYSAIAALLAEAQLGGRLAIRPKAIMCVAESLTQNVREHITRAWNAAPFENYSASETGVLAAECSRHFGLHLFEDLVISEIVDDRNGHVPPGVMGSKILATVLFSRTLPLIRYELDDAASYSVEPCSCGVPFARLTRIGGRVAETLKFAKDGGGTAILHPTDFEDIVGLVGYGGLAGHL